MTELSSQNNTRQGGTDGDYIVIGRYWPDHRWCDEGLKDFKTRHFFFNNEGDCVAKAQIEE